MEPDRTIELIWLFERKARKYLNTFDRHTCIEQTRILIETLGRFDIRAEALGTKFICKVPSKEFQFFVSGDPVDHENAKKHARGFAMKPGRPPTDTKAYHVAGLIERRIFVDLTAAQASVPEWGFVLESQMLAIPFPEPLPEGEWPDIKVSGTSDNGVDFTMQWIGVADRDWEPTPAWEPSHLWPLIDIIEAEMRLSLSDESERVIRVLEKRAG